MLDQLEAFETALERYEAQSRETMSDALRVAIVQKGLRDETLRAHLILHSGRLQTFKQVKEEVRAVITTRLAVRQAAGGSSAMELDPLLKKGRGKGKSDGKAKGGNKGKSEERPKPGGKGQSDDGKNKSGKVRADGKVDERQYKCFYCG